MLAASGPFNIVPLPSSGRGGGYRRALKPCDEKRLPDLEAARLRIVLVRGFVNRRSAAALLLVLAAPTRVRLRDDRELGRLGERLAHADMITPGFLRGVEAEVGEADELVERLRARR